MAAGDINTYGAIRSMTGDGKAAYASQIYDEAQGKFQDQINQETANEGLVSAKVAQTFTDAEKEQARTNISASSQEDVEEILDEYARQDGFYEQMAVGSALALAGQTQRTNDAMYRKSGGSEEVTTGTATIANIKGKTLAWNQRRSTIEGYSYTANGITASYQNGVYTLSGTQQSTTARTIVLLGMSDTEYFVEGHKYAIMLFDAEGLNANVYLQDNHGSNFNKLAKSTIITHGPSFARFAVYFFDKATELHTAEDVKFGLNYCDLTLIYGVGNEPTTPEQFEADYFKWFGKPLTYEEYDEGSLRSVQLEALKTVGFNQYNNGSAKVIGGLQYQITGTYTSITLGNKTITPDANGLFTPSTSGTLTIAGGSSDTCVHISGDRNGEYEPYEEHVAPLPVTTLKGKLNRQGESVTIFPDGMRSAGTIADEIYTVGDKTYAVKRVGSVDMGSLTWRIQGAGGNTPYFLSKLSDVAYNTLNTLLGRYSMGTVGMTTGDDKTYGIYNNTQLRLRDYERPTAEDLIIYLQGVMLYYELETPLVYEVEGFTLPKTYLVDNGGTEEQVQKANVQGLAAILTCIYGVDAVGILDKLPRNYISEKSMDNFLAKLNIATGGTWSKTFNENTGEWDFNFQISANTNANTNEESI